MRVRDAGYLLVWIMHDYSQANLPGPGAVFVNDVISLTDLVHKYVYAPSGKQEGAIENIMVDPASGIVRFASIKVNRRMSILMPWAAMVFNKSKNGFVLTHRGEAIMRRRGSNQDATADPAIAPGTL